MIVVCMKWGNTYSAQYVNILRRMFAVHLSIPHEFVCLTDDPIGIDQGITIKPVPDEFPGKGMWNKVSLFRRGLFREGETVLYSDLDVVLVKSVDPLLKGGRLAACRRFDGSPTGFNSSIIRFRSGTNHHIYERFVSGWFISRRFKNDQDWLSHCCPDGERFPDDLIVSFKLDMRRSCVLPANAAVVVFHGNPKPPDVDCAFARQYWL
jgi:hypothetical protein